MIPHAFDSIPRNLGSKRLNIRWKMRHGLPNDCNPKERGIPRPVQRRQSLSIETASMLSGEFSGMDNIAQSISD